MSASRAEHAPVFAALGDATRLAIVAKLAKGTSRSITELTEGASVTRQAITKHLRVLEAAGIVRREPVGREMLFLLEAEPLVTVQQYLERVCRQWDDALATGRGRPPRPAGSSRCGSRRPGSTPRRP